MQALEGARNRGATMLDEIWRELARAKYAVWLAFATQKAMVRLLSLPPQEGKTKEGRRGSSIETPRSTCGFCLVSLRQFGAATFKFHQQVAALRSATSPPGL